MTVHLIAEVVTDCLLGGSIYRVDTLAEGIIAQSRQERGEESEISPCF